MNKSDSSLSTAPRFTLGLALLLWGWQTGYLLFAIPMIVLIELSNWANWRWPISHKEFNNVSDLSGVGFFITVVYIFTTSGTKGIFVVLSIMPFVLLPLILLQRYSERSRIPASSLFVSLRRLDPVTTPEAAAEFDLSLPYLLLCIIAASSGNQRTIWFMVFVYALVILVLWSIRPKRYSITIWAGLLCLAFMLSYASQQGIRDLQSSIESTLLDFFDQFMWRQRDPERASTAIGSIGRLKLSDRIVLRVNRDDKSSSPLLLREASYQNFNYGVWTNADSKYTVIDPAISGNQWTLARAEKEHTLDISVNMLTETGVIPLPHGSNFLYDVGATEINQSQYGTVKMEIREGWVNYKVDYQSRSLTDGLPQPNDLVIAKNYRPDFDRLVSELELKNKPDIEIVQRISNFFAKNFRYTLNQRNRFPRNQYLTNFLFTTRAGHCEYFATSTVLLLRAAGIPARYVTGYAVDEYSRMEGQYIARSRDAHAWVIAYVNNNWQVLDTTPGIWAPEEDENASPLEPLMDIYAWFSYRLSMFQSQDVLEEESSNNYLLYLLIPLILILAWRLYFKERVQKARAHTVNNLSIAQQGLDSGFYKLISELNQQGHARRPGETLLTWTQRIKQTTDIPDLEPLLALHYRYRFDPGVSGSHLCNEIRQKVDGLIQSGQLAKISYS